MRPSLLLAVGLPALTLSLALTNTPASAQTASTGTAEHWGSFFGDSNHADSDLSDTPVTVTLPAPVAEIGTSNSNEYALLTNGSLYAWGQGTHGELGNGSDKNSFTQPVQVRFPAGVKIASVPGNTKTYSTPVELPLSGVTTLAGANGQALYDANGTVYACGYNSAGQLGDGALNRSSSVPVHVSLPGPVTQVALGGSNGTNGQTLVLLSNGSLRAWGDDQAGELGDGGTGVRSSPVQFFPPSGVTYTTLATGAVTSYALSAAGDVYAWGAGGSGQMGDGTMSSSSTPVMVASGATLLSSTANNVAVSVPGGGSGGS